MWTLDFASLSAMISLIKFAIAGYKGKRRFNAVE